MIFIKTGDNQVRAFYNKCPYDDQTDLSQGFILNDKLICPCHGCSFSLKNGKIENAPAQNDILIYKVDYNQEENSINLNLMKNTPKFIYPQALQQSSEDMRKVFIIGDGQSGMSTAENLRKFGYTGKIDVFTNNQGPPLKKQNLTKFMKFRGNEKNILNRDQKFWQDLDISIYNSQDVVRVENDLDTVSYIELQNGLKLYYDVLVVASGLPNEKQHFFQEDKNVFILKDLKNFQKACETLKRSQNIVIGNVTEESLELASTIKQYYPRKHIKIIDFNEKTNPLQKQLQNTVFQKLRQKFKKEGIKILLQKNLNEIEFVYDYQLSSMNLPNGKEIPIDIFYYFPFQIGQENYLSQPKEGMLFYQNRNFQIPVDKSQKSNQANVFAVGNASQFFDPISEQYIKTLTVQDGMEQGKYAAMSILEHPIENKQTSFGNYKYFGQDFFKLGNLKSGECQCNGEIENLDFICYYSIDNLLTGVVSSGQKNNKKTLLLREAMNNKINVKVSSIIDNEKIFYNNLFKFLNENQISKCKWDESWFL